uniref:LVIVD repeat protein n=1 Tax=candidate division WOR-3 bacterium TaxID=2052148 RepID=A0A7C6AHE0_UNCW3
MTRKIILFTILILSCHRPQVETHNFVIVSECRLPGYPKDIDIKGNYAYIANDQGGLQIVDISNPESTYIVGHYYHQTNIQGVAVRDSFAYLALAAGPPNNGGMLIVNVAKPSNPTFVGQDNWFYGYNVFAPENDTKFVYIAARYWFIVEDVSWPQYPSYVRRFATPGNVHNLYVIDSLAFLACEQMGLIIYNLNNPDSTAQISEMDTPSNARDINILGNYAYIADGYDGLVIIDITNPQNPAFVSSFDTPGYAQGVFVKDNLAYIADGSDGLKVIDVSDPYNPILYGEKDTPYAYCLYVKDSLIYLLDRDLGLVIIEEENR